MFISRSAIAAALLAGAIALVPAAAQAGTPKQDYCKKQKQSKKCPPAVKEGRMTGHGQVFNYAGFDKVQWEFRNSVCNSDRFPDLKVEFGGNKFILTSYTTPLTCFTRDPSKPSTEGHPVAGFDSIKAQGTGTLNGAPAGIDFRFTDAGEPGVNDTATFQITDANGTPVITVTDVKIQDGGNHQAHRR
jgi:hypothetical protein